MNMLNNIRLPDFDELATKTANCLLGFECETESNVAKGSVNESSRDKTAAGGKPNVSNASTVAANNPDQAKLKIIQIKLKIIKLKLKIMNLLIMLKKLMLK